MGTSPDRGVGGLLSDHRHRYGRRQTRGPNRRGGHRRGGCVRARVDDKHDRSGAKVRRFRCLKFEL